MIYEIFNSNQCVKLINELRIFWCMGVIDQQALMSASDGECKPIKATDVRKMSDLLQQFMNHDSRRITYLNSAPNFIQASIRQLESLFNSEPFTNTIWTHQETPPKLKVMVTKNKPIEGMYWTSRAMEAWKYLTQYFLLVDQPLLQKDVYEMAIVHGL